MNNVRIVEVGHATACKTRSRSSRPLRSSSWSNGLHRLAARHWGRRVRVAEVGPADGRPRGDWRYRRGELLPGRHWMRTRPDPVSSFNIVGQDNTDVFFEDEQRI